MNRRDFLAHSAAPLVLSALHHHDLSFRVARPVPTAQQLAWHTNELSAFFHFGVNTFTDREWGDGTEDPVIFNPAGLDARQWIRAAKAGGFRTAIITAKHHDGFCLWPSRHTQHSVASSLWREGRGDVVRDFTDACRAESILPGVYLSPWDRHEPSYGDSPRYNDYYIAQLTELLTQYGPIAEVWLDGANGEGPNGRKQVNDWARIHTTVRRLAPKALIFSDAGPDLRWIGNEKGVAGDPNWCTMDPAVVPFAGADGPGIIDALQHGNPGGTVWRPGEADVSIRPGWFYHTAEDDKVRSPENLMELYMTSVGRNAGLLLNLPPNRDGLVSPVDEHHVAEFGARRRATFSSDLVSKAANVSDADGRPAVSRRVIDDDPDSFWSPPGRNEASWLQLEFATPIRFNLIAIQEAILHGQSVSSHRVDVWNGQNWEPSVEGTTIGAKRLHAIKETTTTRVRLYILSSGGPVRISRLGLYHTGGE